MDAAEASLEVSGMTEKESVTVLSDADYERFVKVLDEPVPQAAKDLVARKFTWAD